MYYIFEYENTPTEKANNGLTCTVPSKYSHPLKDQVGFADASQRMPLVVDG
jgi:hypothetical protein